MDEGNQIQQKSDVSEVLVAISHTSPGHSGRDDGKTEKSCGPPEATLPRVTKMAIGEGVRAQHFYRGHFFPYQEEKTFCFLTSCKYNIRQ